MTGRGWAYLGVLLGGVVSIAANVAHSYVPPAGASAGWRPHAGAVGGAVFWPVALFVAIEIFARTVWPAGGRWVAVRFGGLLPVALLAAVVSYRHLAGLLAFYGEDGMVAAVGPLAVDGLMVVATGALIATGTGRNGGDAEIVSSTADTEPVVPMRSADASPAQPDEAASPTPAKRVGKPDTAAAVARLRQAAPGITQKQVAQRLRISVRTVSRNWATSTPANDPADTPTAVGNGHRPEITVREIPAEPWSQALR